MGKLFGTDGVRGVANAELGPELAFRLGKAAVRVLGGVDAVGRNGRRGSVALGRDTRRSGDMLAAAVAAGVASEGFDVHDIGVVPTPGVAHWTRSRGAAFGVVISASHNPPEDNGIKFFGGDGFKLDEATEAAIERLVNGEDLGAGPTGLGVGRVRYEAAGADAYAALLLHSAPASLDGMRIVVDCANGAASGLAPRVLEGLGADVIALGNGPDGMNINVGCGSLHTEPMRETVRRVGADAGIALDGDADRIIMSDEAGNVVNGDGMMAVAAISMHRQGLLRGGAIAATVYSNYGLHKSLRRHGISVVETDTGDRFVMEALRRDNLVLGGEESGHIIFLEHNTTGDGLLAALQVLGIMRAEGKTLQQLTAGLEWLPRVNIPVPVSNKQAFHGHEKIHTAIAEGRQRLGSEGRLFVRPSGTEPVIRVLGEGDDAALVRTTVDEIANLIASELG